MTVRITDLTAHDGSALLQAAELLVELLHWPSVEAALQHVRECVSSDKIARMAIEGDAVLGWIGSQPHEG